ncbi:hypothetical protein TEA_008888 [Camellia sinensis var. sinensis]|uniref:Ribonucleotide reductase large subunit C-terminal domain-containing protein n=1 Tax=Camellia sinensis var. sinensis TaxID=542762 RepID=A0A4S4D7N4_CAMSN|nr:hypothetical protein TEA_008888 [Camellia sinensis var. sinensis]
MQAQQLNKDIFETIYYHALKASSELAAKEGPYETYSGSPVSKGILQPVTWGVTPSSQWDWGALPDMIANNRVRNSLLVAPMPTASTSQILGNNKCFEPYTSNIYSHRVLSGEFVVVNKHLLHDLTEMGLWSPALKNQIIYEDGSVQKIPEIPDELKVIYKTVWEIKQKTLVDMVVDRGYYIDQSQSLNIHMDQPNFGKLTSLHFHAWSKGLKTGMYYLRSRAVADAIKFTVDTFILNEKSKIEDDESSKMPQMEKPKIEDDESSKMAQMVNEQWVQVAECLFLLRERSQTVMSSGEFLTRNLHSQLARSRRPYHPIVFVDLFSTHSPTLKPDITDGLKRLKCRTLIFVGEDSPFHSEAVHMTSKLDRRYSALVEVCDASNQCKPFEYVISSHINMGA